MTGALEKLADADIDQALKKLPLWQYQREQGALCANFHFQGYQKTVLFVNAVAFLASELKHHPDITFGFGHCHITLTTHDVGGVSAADVLLAHKIECFLV